MKGRAIVSLLAACAALACGAPPAELPSALDASGYVERREAALDAFRDGRLDEGFVEAEAALHVAPGAPQPWSLLSEAYARSGRHADAVETLTTLADRYPTSPYAPFHLGWHLVRLERPREAREALERALALDPDLVNAHFSLAEVLLADARYDEAIDHLERARELDPSALRTGALVTALQDAGRGDEAEALATEATERYATVAEFPYAAGVIRAARGDAAGAEAALREAIRRDPDHDRAQRELGLLLVATERTKEGGFRIALAERLRDYHAAHGRLAARAAARNDEPEVPLRLAELEMTLGRAEAALSWLTMAERRGGDPVVVAAERAWVYFSQRDPARGTEQLRLVGDATFPRALLARAAGAAVAGETARATALLDRAVREGPAARGFLRRAADLNLTLGRTDEAARLHERASALGAAS